MRGTVMPCPACHRATPADSRFCPACGEPLSLSDTPTLSRAGSPGERTPPKSDGGRTPSSHPSSSTPSLDQARFVPGTMLADRYRIVALAGKGGMGEVYRAEDLKLGQAVALKFLPEALAADAAALARFHREVRVTRQVSHPNVCRVFDIGEAGGLPFMAMEHVDGEDLASLLRRIGRLPQAKAVEIARQMCAGLAAAHEFGVLHRDLKPSNVMLDSRGKVRITDFGLAGIVTEFRPDEIRAGTPAYMAPEQLEGREVTVRSDIYALGLVLYELFTGKRPFEASTFAELRKLQEQSSPASPASVVRDLDPAVERAILRCLEKDPRQRPASALQVAAALPGGDPLAAALAAGETPSPEMVAASGETEGLRPGVAWACLGGIIVFTLLAVVLSAYTKLYRFVPMEKPPEALAVKAQEILQTVGVSDAPADSTLGFKQNVEYLRYIAKNDKSPERWNNIETGAMGFWYRSSPRPLEATGSIGGPGGPVGAITSDNPPLLQSGMTLVWLTPQGRLNSLVVVPPQVEKESAAAPANVDWSPLFAAAGLDSTKWPATQSTWTPPVYSDTRAAWTGASPERPNIPMRIEAAAYRGKPVYFELIGPWTRPERMQPYEMTIGERVGGAIGIVFLFTLLVGGALLARRNFRMGRGDRKGAARLAGFTLVLAGVNWLLGTHHVPNFYELALFVMALSFTLFYVGVQWMVYVALEPYVRRRWPATLVSWSRLLAGGLRDPLVGRDLLAGSLLGTLSIVVSRTILAAPAWFGQLPQLPFLSSDRLFLGGRILIADAAGMASGAPAFALALLFLLFLFRLLLRKDWLAGAAYVLLAVALSLTTDNPVTNALSSLVISSAEVFLLIRFGLLAITAEWFANSIIAAFPLTTQLSVWYAGTSFAGLALLLGLAVYAFVISLGGRPAFGTAALEE